MSNATNKQSKALNIHNFKRNSESDENQESCCAPYTREYDGNGSYFIHMFCKIFCCPCVYCGLCIDESSKKCGCMKSCSGSKKDRLNAGRRRFSSNDDNPFYYEEENSGFDTNRGMSLLITEERPTVTETGFQEESKNPIYCDNDSKTEVIATCIEERDLNSKESHVGNKVKNMCHIEEDRDFHRGGKSDIIDVCHNTKSRHHHADGNDSNRGYHHTSGNESSSGREKGSDSGYHHKKGSASGYHHKSDSDSGYHHKKDSGNGYHHSKDSDNGYHHSKDSDNGYHHSKDSDNGYHHSKDSDSGYHHTKDSGSGHHHTNDSGSGYHHTTDSSSGHHDTSVSHSAGGYDSGGGYDGGSYDCGGGDSGGGCDSGGGGGGDD